MSEKNPGGRPRIFTPDQRAERHREVKRRYAKASAKAKQMLSKKFPTEYKLLFTQALDQINEAEGPLPYAELAEAHEKRREVGQSIKSLERARSLLAANEGAHSDLLQAIDNQIKVLKDQ